MENRLLPINAVLSLLTRGNANPAHLADLEFELAGLEIPVATSAGTVKIDIVLFRQKDRSIIAIEAKRVETSRTIRLDATASCGRTMSSVPQESRFASEGNALSMRCTAFWTKMSQLFVRSCVHCRWMCAS